MNAQGRKLLAEYMGALEEIQQNIVSLRDEEQDKYDNMPEAFQSGEKGDKLETAISEMDEAVDSIATAITNLETACQ